MFTLFIAIAIAALLLLYSFLRIAESAFIHISYDFIDEIDDPNPSDYRIDKFIDKPSPVIIAFSIMKYSIIILITICVFLYLQNIFVFSLNTNIALTFVSVIVITWLFGEFVPLLFSKADDIKVFKSSLFIIVPATTIVSYLKSALPFSFLRHESRIARKDLISMSDISDAIENSEVEDEEVMEKLLIKGVLNFGDLDVKEIMRSRIDVVSFQYEESFESIVNKMLAAGYSRYPVYGDGLDDIKGIVYLKDLLPAMRRNEANYNWQTHLRQALFVPENMKISQLLVDFQSGKMHIAVVVDEYGGTSGIVSLEDILEEIVGEINDEHDADSDQIMIRKIDDNTYIVEAKMPIHDFVKLAQLDSDLWEEFEGEVETLAGIILTINGNFPIKNQTIQYKNIEFTVLSMNKHRIGNIKVKINESEDKN